MNRRVPASLISDLGGLLDYRYAGDPRMPDLPTVFHAQFKMMDQAQLYPMLMLLLAGGSVLAMGMNLRYPFDLFPLPMILLVAVAWAAMVWRSEPPSRRAYHRTMPVDATTHDLVKIFAGAIALVAGISIVFVVLSIAMLITGTWNTLAVAMPLVWLNFVLGALITYLLVSCVPLLTDRPLEWMLGLAASFALLRFLVDRFELGPIDSLVILLISSNVGIAPTLRGLMDPERWADKLAYPASSYYSMEWISGWLALSLLWLSIAMFAVVISSRAANRRPL